MALPGTPIHFVPQGLSDALDGTDAFPGAMMSLQDLIPDPSTKGIFYCRPAAVERTDFSGINGLHNPGPVSVFKVIGSRVYGMIKSTLVPGYDQPFCYDLAANLLIPIAGITPANVPTSQPTLGDWVPPTMDLVGTKLVVTHPGFVGSGNFFGYFDISTPSAVTWAAGNTAGTPLPYPPTAVIQFYGRAYYICNPPNGQPALIATDSLDALTRSNATYVLTFGDNVPLTAVGGLPLNNQLGGVIQALIVFKGAFNMYQVTGDFALATVAVNTLNVATGTLSPRSVCSTPKGLAFISPDGMRFIDYTARVSDPVGLAGAGVVVPFLNALTPSRVCAAANASVIRISTQSTTANGIISLEYWYDMPRGIWTGPHSFPSTMIAPYGASFILAPNASPASLWQSDIIQGPTSGFVENGQALSWKWQTCILPDLQQMAEADMVETTLNIANVATAPGAPGIVITAYDENEVAYDAAPVQPSGQLPVWGTAVWGAFPWGGARFALAPVQARWDKSITFRRMSLCATGSSSSGIKLGTLFMRVQSLDYLQQ